MTIHISSGLKALISAKKVSGKTKLVGVTVLTSLDNKALKQIGHKNNVKKLVLQQAKLASKAKLDAIVCSAQEIKIVKKVFKKEIITPGIRINKDKSDQKRILTPNQAYKNGSIQKLRVLSIIFLGHHTLIVWLYIPLLKNYWVAWIKVNIKNAKTVVMICVLVFDFRRKFMIKNTNENANKKK